MTLHTESRRQSNKCKKKKYFKRQIAIGLLLLQLHANNSIFAAAAAAAVFTSLSSSGGPSSRCLYTSIVAHLLIKAAEHQLALNKLLLILTLLQLFINKYIYIFIYLYIHPSIALILGPLGAPYASLVQQKGPPYLILNIFIYKRMQNQRKHSRRGAPGGPPVPLGAPKGPPNAAAVWGPTGPLSSVCCCFFIVLLLLYHQQTAYVSAAPISSAVSSAAASKPYAIGNRLIGFLKSGRGTSSAAASAAYAAGAGAAAAAAAGAAAGAEAEGEQQPLEGRYCCSSSSTIRLPTRSVVVGGGETAAKAFDLLHGKPYSVQKQLLLLLLLLLSPFLCAAADASNFVASRVYSSAAFISSAAVAAAVAADAAAAAAAAAVCMQVLRCAAAGSELVRLTVQGPKEAEASKRISHALKEVLKGDRQFIKRRQTPH